MIKCLFIIATLLASSFYDLQIKDSNGNKVLMSEFAGKKILLVNIATGSPRVNQLGSLQQLKQQFGDSLVIIAFPSNSFGHESRSNQQIKQYCNNTYGTTFLLAEKKDIKGQGVQPVYKWLTRSSENGEVEGDVINDFQKFLVNESGALVGVFSSEVDPMDSLIINAISNH